jgi:alkaline phosphatase D
LLGQPNFGTIEIDWDAHPVSVKFDVRDTSGVSVTGVNIPLLELHPSNSETHDGVKAGDNHRHCTLEVSLPWIKRYRLAIFFYFTIASKSLPNSNLLNFFKKEVFMLTCFDDWT